MNFYSNDFTNTSTITILPSLHNFYPSNDTVPRVLKFMNFNSPSESIFKREEEKERKRNFATTYAS